MQDILIVVDMQNDFISGALGTAEAQAIVPKVVEKVKGFTGRVIFTRDTHFENYLSTQEGRNLPVPHCIKGSDGWQICAELAPLCTDICVIANAMVIKAFLPEVTVKVDAACCAGVTPESHKTALDAMHPCQIVIENA